MGPTQRTALLWKITTNLEWHCLYTYKSVAKSFVPPASSASFLWVCVANDKFFFPPGVTKTFSTDNIEATGRMRTSQPRLAERITVLESPGERGNSVIWRPRGVTFPPLEQKKEGRFIKDVNISTFKVSWNIRDDVWKMRIHFNRAFPLSSPSSLLKHPNDDGDHNAAKQ